jgi:hypothetical protein
MSESAEKMEKQLSVRELERLIFLTFMHSQGSPEIQEMIGEWLSSVYGLQDEQKVREAFSNFLESNFYNNDSFGELHLGVKKIHKEISRIGVESQLAYLNSLYKVPEEPLEGDTYFEILLSCMLQRDKKYIAGTGRPNRDSNTAEDNLKNKYFSFIKTYLNDLQTTGDVALDQLYKKLHDWVIDRPEHDEIVLLFQEQERKLETQ